VYVRAIEATVDVQLLFCSRHPLDPLKRASQNKRDEIRVKGSLAARGESTLLPDCYPYLRQCSLATARRVQQAQPPIQLGNNRNMLRVHSPILPIEIE